MTPRISEAEWEIMKVLWKQSPLAAQEIIERLESRSDWKPKTVKALIGRLVQKKAVRYETAGKMYLYSPACTEEECRRQERQSFLQRIYDGAAKPMLVHFLEDESLSPSDIEELRRLLDGKRS
ncbi:BlaI/MecI/CopY family transcriptional regulator [Cohnella caldifontis]|uniref:BlaI/MecI/CopY family transcriptional regulator n=1 Tax=Cohnella caldifontis TaxID=3027471 RepID=UPI0023EAA447|nr:BlaI/MecI/CopY family transcriptional regulator [Cohnella sp. YIM B05605]